MRADSSEKRLSGSRRRGRWSFRVPFVKDDDVQAVRIALTDREFDDLRDLVRARSGIDIRTGHRFTLETRLTQRLHELRLESFSQYLRLLSTGPFQGEELHEMLGRTHFGERCFFRHRRQLETLRRELLPGLMDRRRETRVLRIWTPACSSGEEAYSVAILAHRGLVEAGGGEAGGDWRIEVLGTDASPDALEIARHGAYGRCSLPSVEVEVKRRYFCERARLLHVAPEVRAMVSFRRHLLHDHLGARRLGRWDVIVCRDALSWLDGGTRAEVLGTLCDQLADDGVLLLAPGERVRMGGLPLVGLGVGAPGVYVREGGVGHRGA